MMLFSQMKMMMMRVIVIQYLPRKMILITVILSASEIMLKSRRKR